MEFHGTLTAVITPCEEGGFYAYIAEMPGVQTQGDTIEETKANLEDAMQLMMEYLRDEALKTAKEQSAIVESFRLVA